MARIAVIAILVLIGGFMVFDGVRALTVGDYLTPSSGPYAGQLGPWARVVEGVGVDPRSRVMMVTFVVIGAIHLVAAVLLTVTAGSTWLVLAAAVLGLWYLPFGTLGDLAVILVIMATSLAPWR